MTSDWSSKNWLKFLRVLQAMGGEWVMVAQRDRQPGALGLGSEASSSFRAIFFKLEAWAIFEKTIKIRWLVKNNA